MFFSETCQKIIDDGNILEKMLIGNSDPSSIVSFLKEMPESRILGVLNVSRSHLKMFQFDFVSGLDSCSQDWVFSFLKKNSTDLYMKLMWQAFMFRPDGKAVSVINRHHDDFMKTMKSSRMTHPYRLTRDSSKTIDIEFVRACEFGNVGRFASEFCSDPELISSSVFQERFMLDDVYGCFPFETKLKLVFMMTNNQLSARSQKTLARSLLLSGTSSVSSMAAECLISQFGEKKAGNGLDDLMTDCSSFSEFALRTAIEAREIDMPFNTVMVLAARRRDWYRELLETRPDEVESILGFDGKELLAA